MLHERPYFYKYYTSASALAVLKNATLKWSAPRLFNDPFDLPVRMNYSFSGEEAANALVDEIISLAYGNSPILGDESNSYIQLARLFRSLPNKPSRKEFRCNFSETIVEAIDAFNSLKEKANRKLNEARNRVAVFCVTEKYDNLLMWAHYAENHTGCVFKFSCRADQAQRLHYAQKVMYVDVFPEIQSLTDYVKKLTGQFSSESTPDELTDVLLLTKSRHWEYEKEWRAVFKLEDIDSGYDLLRMEEEEVEAIYIGCKAEKNFIATLLEIVEENYPHISLYMANINTQ